MKHDDWQYVTSTSSNVIQW